MTFDNNLVVSTHNYMSPTGGGKPYPGVIDGLYGNRDILAAGTIVTIDVPYTFEVDATEPSVVQPA